MRAATDARGSSGCRLRSWRIAAIIAAVVALAACASPEATRQRAGGRGADVGNRDRVVVMHEGSEPYYGTPRLIRHGAPVDTARQADALSRSGR